MNVSYDDERTLDRLRYKKMNEVFMAELSLKHPPTAVKYFYTQAEFDYFEARNDFHLPIKPGTFCQWERNACSQEQTIYAEAKDLQCRRAACSFNWEKYNDFVPSTKQHLNKGVFGIAVAPLGKARFIADTVNCTCDSSQADTIINAWIKASGVQPWRPTTAKDSSSCSGNVFVHNKNLATIGPTCPHFAIKNVREEINVILPADHLAHVVDQLLECKISLKNTSFNRPGDGFFKIVY